MNISLKFLFISISVIFLSCTTNKDDIKFGDSIDDVMTLVKSSDQLNVESEYGNYENRTLIISGGCSMLGHEWPRAECSFSYGKLYKVEFKDRSESKSYVEDVKDELIDLCGEEIVEEDNTWAYGTKGNTTGYVGHLKINENSGKVRVHIQSFHDDSAY